MSWKNRAYLTGSFRDVSFRIDRHSYRSGRRIQNFEFPYRSTNYVEDLGKVADGFNLEAYLVGPNYDRDRDDLLAALKKNGTGVLRHPYLGTAVVSVGFFELSEDIKEQNFCKFAINFTESGGRRSPSSVVSTSRTLLNLSQQIRDSVQDFFGGNYLRDPGSTPFGLDAVAKGINTLADQADGIASLEETTVNSAADFRVAKLILGGRGETLSRKKDSLLDGIRGLFKTAIEAVPDPDKRYGALKGMAKKSRPPAFYNEADAGNFVAFDTAAKGTALAGAIDAADKRVLTAEDSLVVRKELTEIIDSHLDSEIFDGKRLLASLPFDLIREYQALRGAVGRRFPIFGQATITSNVVTLDYSVNAISAYYDLTGTLASLDQFLTKNHFPNLFHVAPGTEIEV